MRVVIEHQSQKHNHSFSKASNFEFSSTKRDFLHSCANQIQFLPQNQVSVDYSTALLFLKKKKFYVFLEKFYIFRFLEIWFAC